MVVLQELEFIVGPEDAGVLDRVLPQSSAPNPWGAWSLVPAASPSRARCRRLAAAARVGNDPQSGDAPQPIA